MTEIWKEVPGFNGRYEASNHGNIRSLVSGRGPRKTPLLLNKRLDRDGYYTVNVVVDLDSGEVRKTNLPVSRLVCKAFNGPPPDDSYDCCHIDGTKDNNRPENLMWGTRSENNLHKHDHGTMPIGEAANHSKLTEEKVLAIREEKERHGTPNVHLAKKYGVSDRAIGKVVRRESWTHI